MSREGDNMKPALLVDIKSLYGQAVLSGSKNGEAFLPKLLDAAKHQPQDVVVALDFGKLELVTASFFRTAFRAFRDYARNGASIYPMCANANEDTLEEIRHFADDVGDAFLFGSLDKGGAITEAFVVGRLEDKQAKTLSTLIELGEADAGQLYKEHPDPNVSSSAAWSNRLAALAAKGFLVERLEGRVKRYQTIHKNLSYGTKLRS